MTLVLVRPDFVPAPALTFTAQSEALLFGLCVHVLVSIYDGRFGLWRTFTWVGLVGGWSVAILLGQISPMLPWGQLSFWLATELSRQSWIDQRLLWDHPGIFDWLGSSGPIISLLLDVFVILDVLLLHFGRIRLWRPSNRVTFFAAVGVAMAIDVGASFLFHHTAPQASKDTLRIVPEMPALASYSVLRAVPDKLVGIAIMVAVLLLPMVAPWMRAWRFHAPRRTRAAWSSFCLGLVLSWLGLVALGMMPPEDYVPLWSRVLVLYEFAFYLVVPSVLGGLARPPSSADAIFD